mmetsp:Transcript_13489/g.22967  ORF Transcript_13489/g.22967 Transcript_13489/m.22967 type:complete len:210 (+) Transcript_13489:365-994(+)
MQAVNNSVDLLVHFFIKELEHTWRVKFQESKEFVFKQGVDQIKVIVDLKGSKLKDLSNKQMITVYKQLTLEVQRFFPCMLHQLFVLNAPLFFENIWESELSQCIDPETLKKFIITSDATHEELQSQVDEYELPQIYGGVCDCRATCIYSEKGPWSDVENFINYRDPKSKQLDDSDDDDINDTSERNNAGAGLGAMKGLGGLSMGGDLNS